MLLVALLGGLQLWLWVLRLTPNWWRHDKWEGLSRCRYLPGSLPRSWWTSDLALSCLIWARQCCRGRRRTVRLPPWLSPIVVWIFVLGSVPRIRAPFRRRASRRSLAACGQLVCRGGLCCLRSSDSQCRYSHRRWSRGLEHNSRCGGPAPTFRYQVVLSLLPGGSQLWKQRTERWVFASGPDIQWSLSLVELCPITELFPSWILAFPAENCRRYNTYGYILLFRWYSWQSSQLLFYHGWFPPIAAQPWNIGRSSIVPSTVWNRTCTWMLKWPSHWFFYFCQYQLHGASLRSGRFWLQIRNDNLP